MIICNKILTARQFAECYTGYYFTECDTFDETRKCLADNGIYIKRGATLTECADSAASTEKSFVLVEFSKEEDYTQYEHLVMYIQKKYRTRFLRNMLENGLLDRTE